MKTLLTLEDLYNIQNILDNNGYGEIPLKIQMDILTKERLKQINDSLYAHNTDNKEKVEDDFEQINVKIGNIEFQYKLNENYEV
jgi:hypothetical protein